MNLFKSYWLFVKFIFSYNALLFIFKLSGIRLLGFPLTLKAFKKQLKFFSVCPAYRSLHPTDYLLFKLWTVFSFIQVLLDLLSPYLCFQIFLISEFIGLYIKFRLRNDLIFLLLRCYPMIYTSKGA